jgi:hypothetical protein
MVWDNLKQKVKKDSYFIIALFVVLVLSAFCFQKTASADLTSCSINLSPQLASPGSDNYFTFGIFNSSDNPIQWVKITTPPGNYLTIESAAANGWNSDTSDGAVFSGGVPGQLDHGSSQGFVVQALASNNQTLAPISWSAQVSDDSHGANPISCDGDLSMAIAPQPSQILISNVMLSSVSSNSATITWDTDIPATSQINYGLDDGYGSSSALDSNLVTSHSVKLTGLTASTAYHYQVVSTTPDGGNASSGDSTFLTAIPSPPGSTTTTTSTIIIPITNPGDKVPPTISLTGSLPHIVKQIPAISGVAKDDQAVMAVQYSTDNGQNWLPVDSAPGLGSKQVNFSFTPVNLDDGNYTIIVKAFDGGGNAASTTPVTVVVDRLPPLVGGTLISLGPQILTPDTNNVITTLAGIDQKITMSAVGGATSITINASQVGAKVNKVKAFSLTQDINSGLWSGILSFSQPGVYSLVVNSIDGAGNKTSHSLNTINVSSAARVVGQGTNKTLKAQLKLYTYDTDTSSWIVWDGSPFGQTNPQTTGANGSFKLFLPPGKYYLAVTADGYHPLVSNIFNLQKTTPLTTQLSMTKASDLKLGPIHISWPSLSSQAIDINPTVPKVAQSVNPNKLIDKSFPNLTLLGTNGNNTSSISWLGRPTLLSFMVSWLPSTSEQLKPLSELQTNKDINIVPIALQENSDKMRVYTQIAGYSLNWLVDPDSTLTNVVNIQSLPTHYFINRDGVVKKVITGILTKQQIIDNLSSL